MSLTNGSFVATPSCTLRFHPAVKLIKKIIDEKRIGKILSFQYHLGQYLPSWHPWEDFRIVYFSKKNTGACREMFGFELVWLTFALNLGKVSRIAGFTEKLSDLDMTADDRYSAILKFENKISGNMVIDLISKKPFRTLRVVGSDGVLEWEWLENTIKIYDSKTKETEILEVPKGNPATGYLVAEEMYQDEIRAFLDAARGKSLYPYSFEEDYKNLKILFFLFGKNCF